MKSISPGSYWRDSAAAESDAVLQPALTADVDVDVAIIGAGITGLSAALALAESGSDCRRVAIFEAGAIGDGTTGGSSAHLDFHPEQGFTRFVKSVGEEHAQIVIDSRRDSIDQIERWIRAMAIDCDFQRIPAYLYTESRGRRRDDLQAQLKAARSIGIEEASFVDRAPLPFETAGALRLERHARFHPMRFIRGIARDLINRGVAIYENTRILHPPKNGSPCEMETAAGHTVRAEQIIVATHSAFLGVSQIDTRVFPYQSYLIAARVAEDIEDALYWDDDDPYHYIRLASSDDRRLLLIGGADHKTGAAAGDERNCFEQLERFARERFDVHSIERRWSAELYEPADGVPFIGPLPLADHIYVATGFSGTGLTLGMAAGKLIADEIVGRENRLGPIVRPSRIRPIASAPKFIAENIDVARHFIGDRLAAERAKSMDGLAAGEGRIIRRDGRALAVCRDRDGVLHAISPVCTHAGCYVHWNTAEATWDCPCHGGRYSASGERLYGPPPHDLKKESIVIDKGASERGRTESHTPVV